MHNPKLVPVAQDGLSGKTQDGKSKTQNEGRTGNKEARARCFDAARAAVEQKSNTR